jgi:uncharacterized protein YcnI
MDGERLEFHWEKQDLNIWRDVSARGFGGASLGILDSHERFGATIEGRKLMLSKARITCLIPILLTISAAQAHVTVLPRESTAGATQKYTVRVPNEKTIANVRVEVEFPANVEIMSVSEKAGWKLEVKKDASGKATGAVWSGASLAPRDIAEFEFLARNPNGETKLVWKAVQVYEDGSRSEWTGPQGTRSPAPVTQIKPQ